MIFLSFCDAGWRCDGAGPAASSVLRSGPDADGRGGNISLSALGAPQSRPPSRIAVLITSQILILLIPVERCSYVSNCSSTHVILPTRW